MCVWCVEIGAERVADCLALRIRGIGPSTRRYHDDASNILFFGALIVESDVRLVRGNRDGAGRGGGLPRIAYS